jgi:hypothetical protein
VLQERSDDLTWERSPDRFLRVQWVRWFRQKNQFLDLHEADLNKLDESCRRWLLDTARALSSAPAASVAGALHEAWRTHRESLASFLRARLGPQPRDVVCGEYSPSLQLSVLGLSSDALLEPVLDVGCGASAALVRALRAEGRAAHGIDRDAPEDVATAADWLTFPFGVDRWGTVASHLGFPLHFLHHHLREGATAFAYAKAYMAILRSLRTGGTFAYAPALPFIESLLPASTYRCERVALPRELSATPPLRALEEATGLTLGHAMHVRRI